MKAISIALLSFALISCQRSPSAGPTSASDPAEATPAAASISANPNPVPTGAADKGETTISWGTGSKEWGEVYVSENGEPERLFGSGESGATKADWIQTKHHYDFRLYKGHAHQKVLAEVKVAPQG